MSFKIILALLLASASVRAADSTAHFFVFLNTNPNRPKIEKDSAKRLMAGHLDNINRLYKEGRLVVSGPFGDSLAGGVFVFKSVSIEALEAMLATDPAIRAGRFTLEIFPLTIRQGSICTAPDENAMAKYPFARLAVDNSASEEMRVLHHRYYHDLARSKNILFHGSLGDGVSVVVFAKNDNLDAARSLVMNDPAVSHIRPTVRLWWNAPGIFCEQTDP